MSRGTVPFSPADNGSPQWLVDEQCKAFLSTNPDRCAHVTDQPAHFLSLCRPPLTPPLHRVTPLEQGGYGVWRRRFRIISEYFRHFQIFPNNSEHFRVFPNATVWVFQVGSGLCPVLLWFAATCGPSAPPLHFITCRPPRLPMSENTDEFPSEQREPAKQRLV